MSRIDTAILTFGVILSILVGVFFASPTARAEREVANLVGPNLLDESSLKVRNLVVTEGNVICAEINAKNAFGAYAGWTSIMVIDGVVTYLGTNATLDDFAYYEANCPTK